MLVEVLMIMAAGLFSQLPVSGSATPEPGWPVAQPAYAFIVDMDNDGTAEVLLSGSLGPAEFGINVFAADGTVVTPSFEHDGRVILPFGDIRLGDIDGDGRLDVVFPHIDLDFTDLLYAFDHLGNVLPGWPVNLNTREFILADLTGEWDDGGRVSAF